MVLSNCIIHVLIFKLCKVDHKNSNLIYSFRVTSSMSKPQTSIHLYQQ